MTLDEIDFITYLENRSRGRLTSTSVCLSLYALSSEHVPMLCKEITAGITGLSVSLCDASDTKSFELICNAIQESNTLTSLKLKWFHTLKNQQLGMLANAIIGNVRIQQLSIECNNFGFECRKTALTESQFGTLIVILSMRKFVDFALEGCNLKGLNKKELESFAEALKKQHTLEKLTLIKTVLPEEPFIKTIMQAPNIQNCCFRHNECQPEVFQLLFAEKVTELDVSSLSFDNSSFYFLIEGLKNKDQIRTLTLCETADKVIAAKELEDYLKRTKSLENLILHFLPEFHMPFFFSRSYTFSTVVFNGLRHNKSVTGLRITSLGSFFPDEIFKDLCEYIKGSTKLISFKMYPAWYLNPHRHFDIFAEALQNNHHITQISSLPDDIFESDTLSRMEKIVGYLKRNARLSAEAKTFFQRTSDHVITHLLEQKGNVESKRDLPIDQKSETTPLPIAEPTLVIVAPNRVDEVSSSRSFMRT